MAFEHFSRSSSSREQQGTIIGESMLVTGTISGDENLTVMGRLEGSVSLSQTLEVAPNGIVKADVAVEHAVVSGIVVGNVSATGCVEVTETGRLVGDIQAPRVIIVAGARVRGQVDMSESPSAASEQEGEEAEALSRSSRLRLPARRPMAQIPRPSQQPQVQAQQVSARPRNEPQIFRDLGSPRDDEAFDREPLGGRKVGSNNIFGREPPRVTPATRPHEFSREGVASRSEAKAHLGANQHHAGHASHAGEPSVVGDLHPRYSPQLGHAQRNPQERRAPEAQLSELEAAPADNAQKPRAVQQVHAQAHGKKRSGQRRRG